MYSVSQAYLTAAASDEQEHKLTGTIGSTSFDESNIVDGSFKISNTCSDNNEISIGSVVIGELTATFTGIMLERGAWRNKVITPTFSLKTGENTWENVPLGKFKIKAAKHTSEGVQVTAYDNMRRFDKKFKKRSFRYTGTMYDFLSDICTKRGVTFGMTSQEVAALPNGSNSFRIYGSVKSEGDNDIKTYRDCISYIAQVLGCFATMDRTGALVLRKYGTSSAVVSISDRHRLDSAVFEDFTTKYIGLFVNDMDSGDEIYYGYDVDDLNDLLSNVNATLQDITTEMQNVEIEYQNGNISENDYTTQMSDLNYEYNACISRQTWINSAITYSQQHSIGDGSCIVLGDNPFLQDSDIEDRDTYRWNIVSELMNISFVPFTASMLCGAHFDLGDTITFTGGHAGDSVSCCVMDFIYSCNDAYEMAGMGSDPDLANVHTLARKKASVALKEVKEKDVKVTNYYNANDGVEIAQIDGHSIYAPAGGSGGGVQYRSIADNHIEFVPYE